MIQTSPVLAVLDREPRMRKALRRLLATHGFRLEAYEQEDILASLPSQPADCLLRELRLAQKIQLCDHSPKTITTASC
jgi:FixJ family two-component response regulator